MNKNDIKLIIVILIFIVLLFSLTLIRKKANIANVYYENELILEIDLSINNTYEVSGDNGKVVIEVLNNQIRVVEENSPYHLCSKQGFVSKSGESIICLPNKIIIELPSDELDAEVS